MRGVADRLVDSVAEGYDAGVRLAEAIERDMVQGRLSEPGRFVVVGAPAPVAYAMKELTADDEARIVALVKKAAGRRGFARGHAWTASYGVTHVPFAVVQACRHVFGSSPATEPKYQIVCMNDPAAMRQPPIAPVRSQALARNVATTVAPSPPSCPFMQVPRMAVTWSAVRPA